VIELKPSKVPLYVKSRRGQTLLAGLLLLGSSSVLLLSGCSSAFTSGGSSLEPQDVSEIKGAVHGGQQPVSGSTVQIYEVLQGAGYGAKAQAVTADGTSTGTVVSTTTNGSGGWTYPAYTCASQSDELYVVSTGGNPGLTSGTNNPSLALAAALGPCSNVSNVGFVFIDEATTVATAYSLAGFMTDAAHVGTSTGNTVGLTNAFATFNNLVNLNTGNPRTVTPAYATQPSNTTPDTVRSIVPYDLINTLADALAACVNTDGGNTAGQGGGIAGACTTLFGITGNKTNETTLDAALYMAHNPGLGGSAHIATLVGLVSAQSPFQATLASTPTDLTMTLNFTGGGLGGVNRYSKSGSAFLAIDQEGNIWIPSYYRSSVAELNNLGAPLSPNTTLSSTTSSSGNTLLSSGGWGASVSGLLTNPEEVAIDTNGNAWVSDPSTCLAGFSSSGSSLSETPYTGACGTSTGAIGVSVDGTNQVWVGGGDWISSALASSPAIPVTNFPITSGFNTLSGFLGPDASGNTWYIDQGDNKFGAYEDNGTSLASSNTVLAGPGSYAAFGAGPILVIPEGLGGTLNVVDATPTKAGTSTSPTSFQLSSESSPEGVAVDGNNYFYLANQGGTTNSGCSVETQANLTVFKSSGSLLSPACVGYVGGSALTALAEPGGVGVDQSGNVWVVNYNNGALSGLIGNGVSSSNVTEFVGLAAPVNPVFAQNSKSNTYGTKP
jgi:hypothetical protein